MPGSEAGTSHRKFKELCALAQTRTLGAEERRVLAVHLKSCVACRRLVEEYARIGATGMPVLQALCEPCEGVASWDDSRLRKRLMALIRKQRGRMASIRTNPLCWCWKSSGQRSAS